MVQFKHDVFAANSFKCSVFHTPENHLANIFMHLIIHPHASIRLFRVPPVSFETMERNYNYLVEMLTIVRKIVVRRFDLPVIKVTLNIYISITKFRVSSVSFVPMEGN
jgi:hypothetical protein